MFRTIERSRSSSSSRLQASRMLFRASSRPATAMPPALAVLPGPYRMLLSVTSLTHRESRACWPLHTPSDRLALQCGREHQSTAGQARKAALCSLERRNRSEMPCPLSGSDHTPPSVVRLCYPLKSIACLEEEEEKIEPSG